LFLEIRKRRSAQQAGKLAQSVSPPQFYSKRHYSG